MASVFALTGNPASVSAAAVLSRVSSEFWSIRNEICHLRSSLLRAGPFDCDDVKILDQLCFLQSGLNLRFNGKLTPGVVSLTMSRTWCALILFESATLAVVATVADGSVPADRRAFLRCPVPLNLHSTGMGAASYFG